MIDELDAYISHLIDREVEEANKIVNNTSTYRYNHSQKRKDASARYLSTEKGKETRRKSRENYAKNHPDRVRAKQRLYYMRHKDEIKLRRIKGANNEDGTEAGTDRKDRI